MAIVPTVRLLITAIAATPRLATTLHHRLRAVIRLLIIRALRPLAATAAPRVVAIMVAAEAAAPTAAEAAAPTAAGEAALTVVADLMAVTAEPCTFRDASCRSYNSLSRSVLNINEAGFPA